jgi:hypothetical protein
MTMTEYENIMNSGKLYKVMELTNQDPQYHDYLQQMENYNQLGYSPEEEMEKHEILKKLFAEVSLHHIQYHQNFGQRAMVATNLSILVKVCGLCLMLQSCLGYTLVIIQLLVRLLS